MNVEKFSYLNRFVNESNMPESMMKSLYEMEIPPGIPVLLNDINALRKPSISEESLLQSIEVLIGTTYKPRFAMYVGSEMLRRPFSDVTLNILRKSDPKKTAILLPGNGATACMRESFSPDSEVFAFPIFQLPTERILKNNKPIDVTVDVKNSNLFTSIEKFTRLIVIDDVIASGLTTNTLVNQLRETTGRNVSISALTWMIREPTAIQGYDTVTSVFRYFTSEGWPAVNSLSTLLRSDEKGYAVRDGYIKKYIAYPYGFIKQLNEIKKLTCLEGEI